MRYRSGGFIHGSRKFQVAGPKRQNMSTRRQNEKKFGSWEALPGGGRCYRLDVTGRLGWQARYLKEVDAKEITVRFWQEIYDDTGQIG